MLTHHGLLENINSVAYPSFMSHIKHKGEGRVCVDKHYSEQSAAAAAAVIAAVIAAAAAVIAAAVVGAAAAVSGLAAVSALICI